MARNDRRGIATNEIAIAAVVFFIVGTILFAGCEGKRQKTLSCLRNLGAAADGAGGATCPVSDLPFAPVKKDGVESVACPDPKSHLANVPRYERKDDRPYRLTQGLPAVPGTPDEVGRRASSVAYSANGSTSILHVRPRWWWRWLAGPLVQLLAIVYWIALISNVVNSESRESRSILVVLLVTVVSFTWMGWHSLSSARSQAFELDPARRQVTHRSWFFGREQEAKVYRDCDGVVFVPVRDGVHSLVLMHRDATQNRTPVELIDGLSAGDAAFAARLQSRW